MGGALIVADDNQAGARLAEFCRRKGFPPTVWRGDSPDLSRIRQLQPDFILLAAGRAESAAELCQHLKLDPETNLIPVVMVHPQGAATPAGPGHYFAANAYVADAESPEQLQRAVDEALAWRTAARGEGVAADMHVRLHSDLKLLDELNRLLSEHLRQRGLAEPEAKQVTMAVRELGANAIEWGHRREVDRVVTIHLRVYPRKVTIMIRDTGTGFNRGNLPHAANPDDPVSHLSVREELGLREGGFGIMIAGGLVDELYYNETGNEVRLVKHLTASPAQGPAD